MSDAEIRGALLALATSEVRKPSGATDGAEVGPYRETKYGLVRLHIVKEEQEIEIPLTNFTARIIADVTRDDGAEVTRVFEIKLVKGNRTATATVPAAQFHSMRWHIEALGAEAVILAGSGTADHTRAAIQLLSGSPPRRTVYAHTGWCKITHEWVYLHADGGIGAAGAVESVAVSLPPELAAMKLELTADADATKRAVEASLCLLDVGPDRITIPLYGAIWRSIIGGSDFAKFLYGPTGTFKSELSALTEQHFGSGFDARHLPASFVSTANSNEALAFAAKDMILVVDELHPPASGTERELMHRDAARLLRSQGNAAGRGRMRSDGTLRPARPPRGLMVATGEELPRGQSVHARLYTLEIQTGAIDAEKLTACQVDAAAGLYAQATAAFVRWLAPHLDEARAEFEALRREARGQFRHDHPRTADIRAQLTAAYSIFVAFLVEIEVIDTSEAADLQARVGAALQHAANAQAQFSAASEPVGAFVRLLTSAIAAGRAHLADPHGGAPEKREQASGWRNGRGEWQPQGDRVGWLDGDYAYLNRDAAYRAAQGMTTDGAGIEVSVTTLTRRLRDNHLLVSMDRSRETLTVRRVLEGKQHDVLHLDAKSLGLSTSPESDKPDISIQRDAPPNGRMSG